MQIPELKMNNLASLGFQSRVSQQVDAKIIKLPKFAFRACGDHGNNDSSKDDQCKPAAGPQQVTILLDYYNTINHKSLHHYHYRRQKNSFSLSLQSKSSQKEKNDHPAESAHAPIYKVEKNEEVKK